MRQPRALTQEPLAGVPVRRRWARLWGLVPLAAAVALLALRAWLAVAPLDRLAPAAAEPADPPGATARAGSIFIARGGPVIAGFLSDGEARLSFAGQELRGAGLVKRRIIVAHGPAAIRFAAPAGARLVWSPVGRRGDPEYVPASSLSPEPPARAAFDRPGTSPLDGAIAAGLLAIAVAALCIAARRRLAAVPRGAYLAMAIVFAAGVAVRWIDLGGFGQAWDEDVNWAAGRNDITNLVGLDFSAASWQWNYEHPPVMKLLAGIGAQFADGFGPARALSAVWIALGCALLVPIGARLFRPRVGALAGAIAALLPPMVAHGQIVGHEAPTVLWWSLGILLALGAHDYLSPDDRKAAATLRLRLIGIGAAIGVAIASRFVNGLLGPLCAVIVVVQAPPRWRRETVLWGATLMPLAAIATVYAIWPRLWAHPIAALAASLEKLDAAHSPEPFLGAITNHPGPHYFAIYLAATLPLGVAAGALVGAVRLIRRRDRSALIAGVLPGRPARRRAVAGAAGRRALRDAVPARARADRRGGVRPARGVGAAPSSVRARSPPPSSPTSRSRCGASTRTTSTTSASRSAAPAASRRAAGSRPRGGARASTARSTTSTRTPRPGRGSTAGASSRRTWPGSARICGPR